VRQLRRDRGDEIELTALEDYMRFGLRVLPRARGTDWNPPPPTPASQSTGCFVADGLKTSGCFVPQTSERAAARRFRPVTGVRCSPAHCLIVRKMSATLP
jgi:hypothetical protein